MIFGCHYDGHDLAQGAQDPTSGLVATLEAARALAAHRDRLERPLRVILFGVEELGLIGAHAYVDAHQEQLDQVRFMLNLDASGGPAAAGPCSSTARIPGPYFRALASEFDEDLIVDMDRSPLREPEHISADHYPFMAAGVPSSFLRDPGFSISAGFYHTAHDTVDKLRLTGYQGGRLPRRQADVARGQRGLLAFLQDSRGGSASELQREYDRLGGAPRRGGG